MKKRIISLVLTVIMLLTMVPTFVFASEATASGNIITLIDFGNPDTIKKDEDGYFGPSALAYKGKQSSFKFIMSAEDDGTGNIISKTPDIDFVINEESRDLKSLGSDALINIRFYSEAVGSKVNFNFFKTGAFSGNNVNWQTTIKGGWQVRSERISNITAKTGNTISFRINDEGWNNLANGGYKNGDTVYVDSIWVDTLEDTYYDNLGEDTLHIWDVAKYPMGTVGLDDAREGGISKYALFTSKSTTRQFRMDMTTDASKNQYYKTVFNTGDYDWVNMWVYSPKAQDDGFNFLLYTNKRNDNDTDGDGVTKENDDAAYIDGVKQATNANTYPLMYSVNQVNWKGWKLISIPMPEAAKNKNIISCELNMGGWAGNYTNCPDINNLEIGFEGIWLSKGEVSPQAEWEAENFAIGEAIVPSEGDIVVADFGEDEIENNYNGFASYDNGRMYNRTARMQFKTITNDLLMSVAQNSNDWKINQSYRGQITLFGASSNTDSANWITGLTENSYLNMMLYNPEPKYTVGGKEYAEIQLIVGYYNGSTTKLVPINIIADWSGWKLVSIPVKEINSNLISTGVNHMYFANNSGWYPVVKASQGTAAVKINTRTAAQKEKGYIVGGTNNVFGQNSNKNLFAYIDVERVWFSQGKPAAEATVSGADLSGLRCSMDNVKLFETDKAVAKADVGAISFASGSTYAEDVMFDNGTATFMELRNGARYSVYVSDAYNSDGVKLADGEYSFDVENYHVSKKTNGGSITVTMHGNIPDEYKSGVMVAAVYNKTTGALEDAEFAQVSNNKVTATVAGYDEAAQDVKFIFINGWGDLKPLKTEVVG